MLERSNSNWRKDKGNFSKEGTTGIRISDLKWVRGFD